MSKNYTADELQQLLRMAQEREAEEKKNAPRPVKVGSLVDYLDDHGTPHVALVLTIHPKGALSLKVFRQARADLVVEAGPSRWRRKS